MLGYAIYDDNFEEVRNHLETGINLNERIQGIDTGGNEIFRTPLGLAWRNEFGETPLYDAIRESDFYNDSPVKWLLKHKVDVNLQNIDGDTPLHIAVERKNFIFVYVLLKANADGTIRNNKYQTPKDYAESLLMIEKDKHDKEELRRIIGLLPDDDSWMIKSAVDD